MVVSVSDLIRWGTLVMLKDLLLNCSFFLSILFVFDHGLRNKTFIYGTLKFKLLLGLTMGAIGALLIVFGIHVSPLNFDLQQLAIVLAAMYGGMTSSMLSAVIITVFRVTVYDFGIHPIIVTILTGVACGFISKLKIEKWGKMLFMNVIGLVIFSVTTFLTDYSMDFKIKMLFNQWGIIMFGGILVFYATESIFSFNDWFRGLETSKDRYRTLVKYSPDGIFVNEQGIITFINDAAVQLLGAKSKDELLGKLALSIVHPDAISFIHKRNCELNSHNKYFPPHEVKYVRLDGSTLNVESSTMFLPYKDRSAIMVSFRDITEKKKMAEDLKESEEKYRVITENMQDLVSVFDLNGQFLYVSPSHMNFLGISPQDLIEHGIEKYLRSEDSIRIKEELEIFKSTIKSKPLYFSMKHQKGYWIDVEMNWNPILDNQGEISKIVAVVRDITERKKSEEKLEKMKDQLSLIYHSVSDIIFLVQVQPNSRFTAISVNDAYVKMTGLTEEFLDGKDIREVFPEPACSMIINQYNKVISTKKIIKYEEHAVLSEEDVIIETALHPIVDDQGDVTHILGVARDITFRKESEEKLRKAKEMFKSLSIIDSLTGIPNRRHFDQTIEQEWRQAMRNSTSLSLILFDIDYFKAFNDTYGHLGGDDCLKQIGSILPKMIHRPRDFIARYGGEEFALILPETNEEGAINIAAKLKQKIERMKIPHEGSKVNPFVTVSIGMATVIPTESTKVCDLIEYADKALYEAKKNGRNQFIIWKNVD